LGEKKKVGALKRGTFAPTRKLLIRKLSEVGSEKLGYQFKRAQRAAKGGDSPL